MIAKSVSWKADKEPLQRVTRSMGHLGLRWINGIKRAEISLSGSRRLFH